MISNSPWQMLIFFVGMLVSGILGYWRGREDEELRWRRVVGNLDKRTGQK